METPAQAKIAEPSPIEEPIKEWALVADASLPTLSYATLSQKPGSVLAAGVWIMAGGLVMIFLGGCFLIGVMINSGAVPGVGPPGFAFLLYILAFICFVVAAVMLFLGVRKLLHIGN